ncbi:MAG: DNA helicase RecQ [Methylobacterium mesophilicum]|nr:DNA helicase RecQ [Methylobacterium mesophilicum]
MPKPHSLPRAVLTETFGYAEFRGQQENIISHVTEGGSCCVLMPTGSGKSLCYQIPALCRNGVGIVVSPLIALMDDQVAALRQLGVRAAALHSAVPPEEQRQTREALRAGALDLLYVAPERLMLGGFLDSLERAEIALFAIDEAHCISQWGHDFRPEYRELSLLRERFPHVPCIAVTATADGPTRADIVEKLSLPRLFTGSFDRPNIFYGVGLKENPRTQLLRFLETRKQGESGIVYCLSRRRVEDTAEWLRSKGFDALPYHAGLEHDVRAGNQRRFLNDEGVVMVATVAFGMGINKPDVRFVAHLDLPKNIEAYYQETGRAGRDGLPATAWMVYGINDVVQLRGMIDDGDGPEEQKRVERTKLELLLSYCEAPRCRRQTLLAYFGDACEPCNNCDTCLDPPETFDGTVPAQKLLSCIYRTGERFGAVYVINVLMGTDDERIRKFGHDQLSTFGIGKDHSDREWRGVLRQLMVHGLVEADSDAYGALRLTDAGATFLRERQSLELRTDARPKPRRRTAQRADAVLDDEADNELLKRLKAERMAIAREQNVPPYVIFHDRTLVDMVRARATTLKGLAALNGVGQTKLERYGERFVEILRAG